jgi:pimeloyl-ACP methyl ester carboxylesterase
VLQSLLAQGDRLRIEQQTRMFAETTYLATEDGWRLALHHVQSQARQRRHPILMLHGFAANRFTLDLDDRYSLARAASARGFEVYVLELRGAGLSLRPGGKANDLQWGFADYSRTDLPVAVKAVLAHSGANAVHGLGHSMGGMLLYSYAVRHPPELRSIASIATPLITELDLAMIERRLVGLAALLSPQTSQLRVPIRSLLNVASRFITVGSMLANDVLLNAANCEAEVMARMAREGISDIPLQLVSEMVHHITQGRIAAGPFAYESQLEHITVPVLALSGAADRVAPPASVEAAIMRVSSRDVRYREMGTRLGSRADYGHIDLMVGLAAPEEVYPAVLDFLEEVD